MTANLEALGQYLSVHLLQQGHSNGQFFRATLLQLNQKNVVAAYSSCSLQHSFFSALLANANVTPIGKFLFATESLVKRNNDMQIKLYNQAELHNWLFERSRCAANAVDAPPPEEHPLTSFLNSHYPLAQRFWVRHSTFAYQQEILELSEVILPEIYASCYIEQR